MKKKILLIICLVMANVATFAQTASVMLLHEGGDPRFFNPAHITDALEVATDGDMLLLSEGVFVGDFTITKRVSLIGAGAKTIISGGITIAMNDTTMLSSYLLDALYLTGSLNITKEINGLKIRKCQFSNIDFNAKTDYAVMENCYCREAFYLNPERGAGGNLAPNLAGMTIYNSKIGRIESDAPSAGAAVFDHCNIGRLYNDYRNNTATYQGCIIGGWTNSSYGNKAVFINCLYVQQYGYTVISNCMNEGCWPMEDGESITDELEYQNANTYPEYGDDDIAYLKGERRCNDGTEVGITGGPLPFTLSPTLPTVSEASYSVDNKEKKLKVTLKVKTN